MEFVATISNEIESLFLFQKCMSRGGVEGTRLEAKAKDTKNFEAKDQGHMRKCSPKKKKVFKKFFKQSQKKGLQNFFSGDKGLQNFFQAIST